MTDPGLSSSVDTVPTPAEPDDIDDPAVAFAAVVALRRQADRLERATVTRALERGWTWAEIAQALGITRQAAHKRLSPPRGPARARPPKDTT